MTHDARYHKEASNIWLAIITLPARESFAELQKTSFFLSDEGACATSSSEERSMPMLHPRYRTAMLVGTHWKSSVGFQGEWVSKKSKRPWIYSN